MSEIGAIEADAPLEAIPLAEVLAAFSHALDIIEGQPEGHCVRASWISAARSGWVRPT